MNYQSYRFTRKELVINLLIWAMISAVFAFYFYRSFIAFIIIFLLCPVYLKQRRKKACDKRKWRLTLDFREYISIVAVNLSSGNSVENSFIKAYTDIKELLGVDADMSKEAWQIIKGLENNLLVEDLLLDLGNRTSIEEIKDFSDIFSAAKRTGGNLREIIENTSRQISDKIEMKRELKVVIAEKELEQKIMCVIPIFIMTYIGITNKGYFDRLYHNPTGIGIMSICLLAYGVAYVWGQKITEAE